jgi:hypothetical protein
MPAATQGRTQTHHSRNETSLADNLAEHRRGCVFEKA